MGYLGRAPVWLIQTSKCWRHYWPNYTGQNSLCARVGLPCQSWSRARRPDGRGLGPLRHDGQYIIGPGLPGLNAKDQQKVREGNQLLRNSIRILSKRVSNVVFCGPSRIPWPLGYGRHEKQSNSIDMAFFIVQTSGNITNLGERLRIFWLTPKLPLSLQRCSGTKGLCSRIGLPTHCFKGLMHLVASWPKLLSLILFLWQITLPRRWNKVCSRLRLRDMGWWSGGVLFLLAGDKCLFALTSEQSRQIQCIQHAWKRLLLAAKGAVEFHD